MLKILQNKSKKQNKTNKNPLLIHVIIPQGHLQGTKGYVSKLLTQLCPVFISPLRPPPPCISSSQHQWDWLPTRLPHRTSWDGFQQPQTERIGKIHSKGGTWERQGLIAHLSDPERDRTGSRTLFSALPSRATQKHSCFPKRVLDYSSTRRKAIGSPLLRCFLPPYPIPNKQRPQLSSETPCIFNEWFQAHEKVQLIIPWELPMNLPPSWKKANSTDSTEDCEPCPDWLFVPSPEVTTLLNLICGIIMHFLSFL